MKPMLMPEESRQQRSEARWDISQWAPGFAVLDLGIPCPMMRGMLIEAYLLERPMDWIVEIMTLLIACGYTQADLVDIAVEVDAYTSLEAFYEAYPVCALDLHQAGQRERALA